MSTRNYVEFYRNKVDYHKYRNEINKFINQIVHDFTSMYKGITNYRIRDVFWELVDDKLKYDQGNWYHVFANFMGRLVIYEILFTEKKIKKAHKDIHTQWGGYLVKLLIPHEPQIPNKFYIELIQNMPVPDYETVQQLYEEGKILFNNENLKEILLDSAINPHQKILKFKVHFNNLFEVLLAKCTFLDQELSKYGETAHKNSFYEIFQLNNFNKRTPPELIRRVLILLTHIRNASSHGSKAGIVCINKNRIRIKDFNNKGELTFEKFFTFDSLYDCYYILLLLIMEFELVAIMISLHRVMRELNTKYNKRFICSQCGYENIVFIHPERTNVVCDKCKSRFSIISNNDK